MRIYRDENGIELAMSRAELEEVRCGRASSRIIIADCLERMGIETIDEYETDSDYFYVYHDADADNYFELSDYDLSEIGTGFPVYVESTKTRPSFEEE